MIEYKLTHVQGLYFEIINDGGKNRKYDVSFIDKKDNITIYETKLSINHWSKLDRIYLSDIAIIIKYEGRVIKQINLLDEIKGKKVFINFESSSIGDTIAWMPYCREFSIHYNCEVYVSTFHNYLFEKMYQDLTFVPRGSVVNNIHAMFDLGWFYDKMKEPILPSTIPLQKAATNILNLPYVETPTLIDFKPIERPYQGKYIAISTISTAQLKHWYYWQELIDELKKMGYEVVEVSKDITNFENIITPKDKTLQNVMNILYHADGYIGLSSGISWLNWALGKKGYMISNFTSKDHEFQSNCVRITNENVCHGCWHNPIFKFNKGDYRFCPEHEDTPRQFECHKSITLGMVMEKIKKVGF
jgi:autotransporter strand-loop-strand O-heptosyltransferase